MRLKLILKPLEPNCTIPINYQYPLSAAIYKILASASSEYAEFLHNKGYLSSTGKPLKLFTFSRLWSKNIKYAHTTLMIKNFTPCTLFVSSPMLADFIQNFVVGLFQYQDLVIGGPQAVARFTITQVETLPQPQFKQHTKFTCLSPIVVSTMHQYQGKLTPYYYRPADEELSSAIQKNLHHKYEIIHQEPASHLAITFQPDHQYIAKRESQGKRVTKKITIKEGDKEKATDIIAFELPFSLQGSTELMEVAYESGIGERNSLGFGMIDVAKTS